MDRRKRDVPNTAHEALQAVREVFQRRHAGVGLQHANEATTRLLIIDDVLAGLGWPKETFHAEHASGAGDFLDYLLAIDGEPWMVVEAKRTGTAFDLPAPTGRGRDGTVRSVSSLLSRGGSAFRETAKQAAAYCNDRAVPLACVTNGYQWVFFRGLSWRGRPWNQNFALVFRSPQEVLARFDDFWTALSRTHARTAPLLRLLDAQAETDPPVGDRPIDCLEVHRPQPDANTAAYVRAACEVLFGDLYGEDLGEMLERCYVEPGSKGDFEHSIARLLKDSASMLDAESILDGDTRQFVDELSRTDRLGAPAKQPIVVAGHVGAGKTTFIHRSLTRLREAADTFFALVDLEGHGQAGIIDARAEEARVGRAVLEKLSRAAVTALGRDQSTSANAIEEADITNPSTLQTMIRKELDQERKLGERLWANEPLAWDRKVYELIQEARAEPVQLLIHFIRHLRNRFRTKSNSKFPILIVLDNLDQASDTYQRCVYGLAQRIARETPALVVICLREDTYLRGKDPGGFLTSSLLQFVFHVRSPPIDRVLRERIRFGAAVLDGKPQPTRLRGILEQPDELREVLATVEKSLLGPRSEAAALIAGLAGHNTREALGLVRAAVMGDTALGRKREATTAYALACLFAARAFGDAATSLHLVNTFDAEPFSPPAHGLKLRLLAYYSWAQESAPNRVLQERTETAVARFAAWGYPASEVENALRFLLMHRLLRPSDRSEAQPLEEMVETPARLTITAAGHLHSRKLWALPPYRAAMALLTRWYHRELFETFVRQAEAASGAGGLTIADVQCSPGLATFDAYLSQAMAKEDRMLSRGIGGHEWVREVRSRVLPADGATAPRDTRPPPAGQTTRKRRGRASAKQLNLGVDARASTQTSLPPIRADVRHLGTVWLPRILWALEWASQNKHAPLSAAEIAVVLRENSQLDVAGTNIARAFRSFKATGASTLWTVTGKRYALTEAGSTTLRAILEDQRMQ